MDIHNAAAMRHGVSNKINRKYVPSMSRKIIIIIRPHTFPPLVASRST